jgi:hypothetical protein
MSYIDNCLNINENNCTKIKIFVDNSTDTQENQSISNTGLPFKNFDFSPSRFPNLSISILGYTPKATLDLRGISIKPPRLIIFTDLNITIYFTANQGSSNKFAFINIFESSNLTIKDSIISIRQTNDIQSEDKIIKNFVFINVENSLQLNPTILLIRNSIFIVNSDKIIVIDTENSSGSLQNDFKLVNLTFFHSKDATENTRVESELKESENPPFFIIQGSGLVMEQAHLFLVERKLLELKENSSFFCQNLTIAFQIKTLKFFEGLLVRSIKENFKISMIFISIRITLHCSLINNQENLEESSIISFLDYSKLTFANMIIKFTMEKEEVCD